MNPNNEIDDDEVDEFLYGSSSNGEKNTSSAQKNADEDTEMIASDKAPSKSTSKTNSRGK